MTSESERQVAPVLYDDDLLHMDAADLLEALKYDEIFGGNFEGVKRSDCTVHVLKGALVAEQKVPTLAEETNASQFVGLEADMTVPAAAKEPKRKGERLFVRVRLPGGALATAAAAAPAGLEGE